MADIAVKMATAAGQQLVREVSLLMGVRGEIQYITDELEIMRGFLKGAEEKQSDNDDASVWVKQVRQLSYDVEDCLDHFSLHLHRGHRPNPLARLCHSIGSSKARHRIATKIQDIKRRVEEASSRRMRYGIITHAASRTTDNPDADVRKYDPRLSALFIEDSQLVGLEGPRKELVGRLLDDAKQLGLIAVVGGGGLGKTTIAKKAYDDPTVTSGHFQCRAWITVSQTYNVDAILRDIIKQLIIPTDGPSSKEMLQLIEELKCMEKVQLFERLRGHLEQKRYLIVFDDVWAIDAWKDLQMALPKSDLGSRIILTTRNKSLAESACATPNIYGDIYLHNKLTFEDSLDLFLRRVFKNPKQKVCPEDLEDLTREILEKCDGLPLAIISIAGVLASKPHKSKREWEEMKSRLGSELEHNPDLGGMSRQILTLSYNDLQYNVRHCYLYLSKFPEDYVIGRKRIQRLWIAEGFISSRQGMTAEEVAESYFNEMANRFMILPSAFSVNGKVRSFRVHDIMLELIVSKSREDGFLSLVVGNKDIGMVSCDVIRRMSVHGTSKHLEQNFSQSHVRSLTIHGGETLTLISPMFGMLRVLVLEGCNGLKKKHLKIVARLVHLKYLSLQDTWVDGLPRCMKRLRKLETLDIKGTYIWKLPEWIIKLQQLRFIYGNHLPSLKIPRGIGRLSAMQVLTGINGERRGKQAMKELREMTQLQKLALEDLSEELVEDLCDSLAAMSSSLRSLSVRGSFTSKGHGRCRLDGLNGLSEPPLMLESLKIRGVLEQLPTWVLSLSNLVKLWLVESRLEEDAIQSLGSLPNLIRLSLFGGACKGESLCFGAQGFPRLKELNLTIDVGSIRFQGGAMCQLERVYMVISGSRSILGITNLPSLKELTTKSWSYSRTNTKDDEWMDEVEAQLAQHPNRPSFIKLWLDA